MKMKICMILLMGLLMFFSSQAMAIQISPEQVNITATYNGQDVVVKGALQKDEQAVVQIIGNGAEVELKQQGKVGGFLWMTVGHISIANAPSAYLLCLPESINTWRENQDPRWKTLNLGFSSLLPQVDIEPKPSNKEEVFRNFVELKQSDSLYSIIADGMQYSDNAEGGKEFSATIHIPAKMPVAEYTVKMLRVNKDGAIDGQETARLQLVETGFPKFISSMAFNRGLLYGVLSVGIAIMAGLFMGIVFKDRGGAH
ncbi:TIGR02186 family protein [Desulfogranum japonicum]|uniref:TIGR02186 family protein n=1 Tax=Desulfogranum japonicum TaxID=231447 RepID=UPI00040B2A22|nr:TIGR02186 family protein [Desulfogranum japonicum]